MSSKFEFGRVLLVDDDPSLAAAVSAALAGQVEEFTVCPSATAARSALETKSPDLLILDVCLPDGTAFDVLEALGHADGVPAILAISGQASSEESFLLARLGVAAFLSKPFGTQELIDAMERACREPVDIRPQVRSVVGDRSLRSVLDEVRETMLDEALARSRGSRRGAAQLLDTSRQVVQYMLRNRGT